MQKHMIIFGALFAIILLSGCIGNGVTGGTTMSNQNIIKDGDKVTVDYWLTVDGNLIDTSEGRGLFAFTVGANQVIPGFDKAVRDMAIGDTKEVILSGSDAYTAGPLAGKELHFKITLRSVN